jgi:hypothetical protein
MKAPIFQDRHFQEKYNQDGFVKIKMFSEQELTILKNYGSSKFPEDNKVFFSSSYLSDLTQKKEISDFIINTVHAKLTDYFINYKTIGAAFLIKGSGDNSEMPMHQDWSIVDEQTHEAINLWIPLIATNTVNGCLEVLKGSHKWNKDVRAPTIPFFLNGHQEKLKLHLEQQPTTLGEVIILNQAVIHYSKPNLSGTIRHAITVGLVSETAQLSIHYWNQKYPDFIEKYEQPDDFLLRFEDFHNSIFGKPKTGALVQKIPYKKSKTSIPFLKIMEPSPTSHLRSFFSFLKTFRK